MGSTPDTCGSESRLDAYVEALTRSLGHADRATPDQAKLRWRVERDYQDLKQEPGLGHYEGRGWRGFHHHATLCIAACGFLIAERGAFPPSDTFWPTPLETPDLPEDYRPRGAPDPS